MTVQTVPLAQEFRETLGRLVRRLRAESGQPPVGHMAVLGRLDREGPVSTSDLAAAERMRPQSMAQNVRELEALGLVSRRPDPHDGRRILVELTEAGLAALHAARARREGWLNELFEHEFTAAERRTLRAALPLLRRIADS